MVQLAGSDPSEASAPKQSSLMTLLTTILMAFGGATLKFSKTASAGSPIQSCPGAVSATPNLNLGQNEIYRSEIIEASNRTRLDPAAIASIIDAEAAKNKKKGVWNPDSQATTSSAQGLTQFLSGTWLQMAQRPGTLLNEEAKKKGLIDEDNDIVDGKKSEILALRTDPEMSIVTGAEYAKSNLDYLNKQGLVPVGATDDQKAKLAYIAHHEGPGGAKKFLEGTVTEEKSEELLKTQVGEKQAKALSEKYGSYKEAYKTWLNDYTDKKIQPQKFRKPSGAPTTPAAPAIIMSDLGSEGAKRDIMPA